MGVVGATARREADGSDIAEQEAGGLLRVEVRPHIAGRLRLVHPPDDGGLKRGMGGIVNCGQFRAAPAELVDTWGERLTAMKVGGEVKARPSRFR